MFVEEEQLDVHYKHHYKYTARVGKQKCHLCNKTFYQKEMLKKHILSYHKEVSTFLHKGRKYRKNKNPLGNRREPSLKTAPPLEFNYKLRLIPGTLMTVYKCPIQDCKKDSCTDLKSFKLHALHIHKEKNILPIVDDVDARYICQVNGCGKLYLDRKQHLIHQRHHKTYVPSQRQYHSCGQCESKFISRSNLDVHIIQVHTSGKDDKNDLILDDVQLEPKTMMTVYHCPMAECKKQNYLDAKSVITHCKRIHKMFTYNPIPSQVEAQFICQVRGCRKLFIEPIQIKEHLKHHRTYIPTNGIFKCSCCPEIFSSKKQLYQHTLECHVQESFIRNNSPHHDQKLVVGYQCTICTRRFLNFGTHWNHVNNEHGQPGCQPLKAMMKPNYTCKMDGCERPFMTNKMYSRHMERHQTSKLKRSASCFKCGKTFGHFKSLFQHLMQTHSEISTEEIVELEQQHAKCPICLSMFRNKEILRNHMRRHEDNKDKLIHNVSVLAPTSPILQQRWQFDQDPLETHL